MILFNLDSCQKLAGKIVGKGILAGKFEKRVFSNGTSQLLLKTRVKNINCAIIGNTFPPSDLFDLILLADTLKKEGARKITAVIPYFAYSRQDRNEKNKSWGMKSIAKIFEASGIDKIITLDLHSEEGLRLFGKKMNSISAVTLFVKQIKKMNLKDFCVIAPDGGAIKRAEELANALMCSKFGHLKKIRSKTVRHHSYSGDQTQTALTYDDILDTGETMLGAVGELKHLGFKDVYIFATHGQFTGEKWKQLFKLGVKEIYTTDTIPQKIKDKRIKILQTAPLIKRAL